MDIKSASKNVLDQLLVVLDQINSDDYKRVNATLGASIGQHVRHIIEFYLRLIKGLKTGIVNYDLRDRDIRIETDIEFARETIRSIGGLVDGTETRILKLELNYGNEDENNLVVDTNFQRELVYNIEHAIHHMAIIKNELKESCDYIELPSGFGIASSTIRYKKGS
jgi:uncharacterized damage-inducible protein DinB